MNIFYLDKCACVAASYMHDTHVRKMTVESCQMLANAYPLSRLADADCPRTQKGTARKHSYPHHPSSKWIINNYWHWKWLLQHATSLAELHKQISGNEHFCKMFIDWCWDNLSIPRTTLDTTMSDVPPPQAMPEKYRDSDTVVAYRRYYVNDKRFSNSGKFMFTWTNRSVPDWVPTQCLNPTFTGEVTWTF